MIDFHSHILPGIDDGSKDVDETRQLIDEEIRQGVTTIVATPHFYANKTNARKFISSRQDSEFRMREAIEAIQDAPEIRVAAEIYYFPGMAKAEILDRLTIPGTDILLIEMPFCQWKEEVYQDIRDIIRKRKFTVILVHIERYIEFQKKKETWEKVLSLPLILQVNAGSFLRRGFFDRRVKWVMNLLKEQERVLIGTDCHNMTSRRPNLEAGREAIAGALGQETLDRIDRLGESLLKERP